MSHLSLESWLIICAYVAANDYADLFSLSRVCRQIYQAATDSSVWRIAFHTVFCHLHLPSTWLRKHDWHLQFKHYASTRIRLHQAINRNGHPWMLAAALPTDAPWYSVPNSFHQVSYFMCRHLKCIVMQSAKNRNTMPLPYLLTHYNSDPDNKQDNPVAWCKDPINDFYSRSVSFPPRPSNIACVESCIVFVAFDSKIQWEQLTSDGELLSYTKRFEDVPELRHITVLEYKETRVMDDELWMFGCFNSRFYALTFTGISKRPMLELTFSRVQSVHCYSDHYYLATNHLDWILVQLRPNPANWENGRVWSVVLYKDIARPVYTLPAVKSDTLCAEVTYGGKGMYISAEIQEKDECAYLKLIHIPLNTRWPFEPVWRCVRHLPDIFDDGINLHNMYHGLLMLEDTKKFVIIDVSGAVSPKWDVARRVWRLNANPEKEAHLVYKELLSSIFCKLVKRGDGSARFKQFRKAFSDGDDNFACWAFYLVE